MANDISARPWFIDTPSPTPIAPSQNSQAQLFIKFIEVVGGPIGVIGNAMAVITDRNGKPLIRPLFQTANAGEVQTYNLENWFEGLIVSALSNGTVLLVHIK